ncbi:hypothetical protein NBRC10512_000376 [Rhodotorula toruloides]|uniref:RHTO0S26e00804g1_1 n=2 Tax=Rhodotorula toruloides TaxID=5286 RepID=A0A061BN30_RHOTO|nr:uncharacterized protein RHTO_01794 [Rhodotorula toruloides NP11]EMS21328.1 hypothetical protein RHTO_01794 [Rhodotorula toruloides NP11]CDR49394.1 RHTO0S26e00804g1_1 [Rhodotorula toruloides]
MSHFLSEVKHALHIGEPTDDPERVAKETHAAQASHEKEEARADRLIAEREQEARVQPATSGPPDVVPPPAELSSFPHRQNLDEVAHDPQHAHAKKQTTPDLEGVTHIPESELPPRLPRMENTALRPSDPNDPNSMNGLPEPLNVAGDDRVQ